MGILQVVLHALKDCLAVWESLMDHKLVPTESGRHVISIVIATGQQRLPDVSMDKSLTQSLNIVSPLTLQVS